MVGAVDEPLRREAVDTRRAALPPDPRYSTRVERRLPDALAGLGRPSEARALLTASLRRLRSSGADPELVERAQERLGGLPAAPPPRGSDAPRGGRHRPIG